MTWGSEGVIIATLSLIRLTNLFKTNTDPTKSGIRSGGKKCDFKVLTDNAARRSFKGYLFETTLFFLI